MSELWTPAEITTALWLDADDSSTINTDGSGNVEQWDDKSGNAYHADQPTPGSRPGLSSSEIIFSNDFLSSTDEMVGSSVALFFVGKSSNTSTARVFDAKGGNADSVENGGLMFIQSSVASTGLSWTVSNGSSANRLNTGSDSVFRGQNSDAIVAAFYENASGRQWVDINASLKSETFPGSGMLARGTTLNELRIGNSITDSSPLVGGLREIIMLSTVPSASVREKIEGYLAHKWGLAGNLPEEHPYKSAAPTLPDPTSTGTGTGTGSTGAPQLLTPLNLFLVSITLPDEPFKEPEPEPAANPLAGPDYIGVYDLTGSTPDSRYQGTTGTTPSIDRVGRVVDLSGNERDLTALDDDGRPKAQAGYALYDDYANHRLASPAFAESGSGAYVAVRFRQDDFRFLGNTLIARGSDDSSSFVAGDQGNGNFRLISAGTGTILPQVTTTSGDHTLEVWAGTPARYSLDGGPILDAANNWTGGLQRLVVGGRSINISNRSWEGRIYRVAARFNSPSASDRAAITDWLES